MDTRQKTTSQTHKYFQDLWLPAKDSRKGENGKLLIIGGSELFHAASKWSLDVASKFVDMVFYASVPSNNQLVKEAKGEFWNGMVVPRDEVEFYLEQAEVILIGPGMTRDQKENRQVSTSHPDWNDTYEVTNYLVQKYPNKKWVIDAGALQMIQADLIPKSAILTPHVVELQMLLARTSEFSEKAWVQDIEVFRNAWLEIIGRKDDSDFDESKVDKDLLTKILKALKAKIIIFKGVQDVVMGWDDGKLFIEAVSGGNAGMTKGGTGDVLAGLVAALYCKNSATTASLAASATNKQAAQDLATNAGPFFNASDLVNQVPKTIWRLMNKKD